MPERNERAPQRPERGQLVVEQVLGRSVVTSARGHGPLRLLMPQNRGGGSWVYQSSLGGGFVGRDALGLEVAVGAGAKAFLSSQAAGKVYRGTDCRFTLEAHVGAGATLIAWPDPTMLFAGSRLVQRQRFDLASGASLLVVDAVTAGRIARGERWAGESLELHLEVVRDGERLLTDGLLLSPRHGPLAERLAGVDAFATVVLTGPDFDDLVDTLDLASRSRQLARLPATLLAGSRWPWGFVLRVGAPSSPALLDTLHALLKASVSRVLGDDPLVRKR